MDINATTEDTETKFYSQKAVFRFSVVFGIYIGSILLAINMLIVDKKRKAWITLLFGFTYSIVLYFMYEISYKYLGVRSLYIIMHLKALGAYLIQFWFWDKYLEDIKYSKKSILLPLVVCLVLFFINVLGMMLFESIIIIPG